MRKKLLQIFDEIDTQEMTVREASLFARQYIEAPALSIARRLRELQQDGFLKFKLRSEITIEKRRHIIEYYRECCSMGLTLWKISERYASLYGNTAAFIWHVINT